MTQNLIGSHKKLREINIKKIDYFRSIPKWKLWLIENIFDVELK